MWPNPGCQCKVPRPSDDPRRLDTCNVCGRIVHHKEWSSSNIRPMVERLLDIPEVSLSRDFKSFRLHCFEREEAGRETFGYRFLGRNNERDGAEEDADATNYTGYGAIRRRREGREELDDLVARRMYFLFKAYEMGREIERRDAGAP